MRQIVTVLVRSPQVVRWGYGWSLEGVTNHPQPMLTVAPRWLSPGVTSG